jgi:hypothetical protein
VPNCGMSIHSHTGTPPTAPYFTRRNLFIADNH